ncbi:MAG TPA: sigma-70 family RNA polymerase sigma factor [Blastocatellia bacterium]|nr:sigma-70 family RNA polymerase sigma factor [Blastocatellia bacterium]
MNDRNDETQFEDFYRQECQALYRYVYARVGNADDALEVAQESFLNLYRMQSGKEAPVYERALLFRMARNAAVDLLRRRRTREGYAREAVTSNLVPLRPAQERTPEELLLEKEQRQCAAAAFEGLGSRDQECLVLRRSGLSYRAVAETMNINPNSVSQAINRALRRFEQAYNALVREQGADEKSGKTRASKTH